MKTILIFFIISISSQIVWANVDHLNSDPIQIEEYTNTQQGTLELPTHFGKPLILNKEQIKELKGKKIFHVDLVYTAFRQSEDFDQLKLNEQRIQQLNRLLPRLEVDDPKWSVYEQVRATDREMAKTFFHGFVIHFGEGISYNDQKEFFKDIQVPFATVGIDNQRGGFAEYYTGSLIEMKKNKWPWN